MTADRHEVQLQPLLYGAEHVVRREDLEERIKERRPLRVKLGLDPTRPDVTLGWAIPLRKLRDFQDAGHIAVLIVGDFTTRIGDPSGQNQTRPQLSKEEVVGFAQAVLDQFMDILSEENLEVRYNSEWLEPLDFAGILRLTSRYTVAQMLERADFAKRFKEHRPISIIEFLYPLAQAYDSVAVEADVELGGTDQLFNLLVGRDIQQAYGQRPQVCMTMPLLEGTDGVQKMSQSLDNYVTIRERPEEMFGKLMSIPDAMIPRYAFLAACMPQENVASLEAAAAAGGPEAGDAKREVARAIVALYHGRRAAGEAEAAFDRRFKQREAPEEMPEVAIPPSAVDGDSVYLPRVLAELGLAGSRSEARRLISQGGVRINGEPVAGEEQPVEDLVGATLQVGKRRFVRLK
ncbi:MAG: tyrosyl-tRNA synthetase [Actinomycetota bacterium]|jgi:tyrosyl-tRNA synthetase|nr:tyrosyl-tRNA synthetase [Actinomycetota bacterium]